MCFMTITKTYADDTLNPVKKALRRAEARPRNMTKSMEDMLTSLSPREPGRRSFFSNSESGCRRPLKCPPPSPHAGNKRRQDAPAESRRISEGEQKK